MALNGLLPPGIVMTVVSPPLSFQSVIASLQAYPECSDTLDLAENPALNSIAPIHSAAAGSLTFLETKQREALEQTQASAIILPLDETLQQCVRDRGLAWIASPHPNLLFARAVSLFY